MVVRDFPTKTVYASLCFVFYAAIVLHRAYVRCSCLYILASFIAVLDIFELTSVVTGSLNFACFQQNLKRFHFVRW